MHRAPSFSASKRLIVQGKKNKKQQQSKTKNNQRLDSRCSCDDLRMSGTVQEACDDLQCSGTVGYVSH